MPVERLSLVPSSPYRKKRPTTDKIIFISCEGSITEEEYFELVSKLYQNVKSKIQFISVVEDIVHTPKKLRTPNQEQLLTKSKPHQLLEKIEIFKETKNDVYDFKNHKDDEFWIIADVDDHTAKYYIDTWNLTIAACKQNHYGYAISNPFFELWLLLHHDDVNADDYQYAVTDTHPYEKTDHFKKRLEDKGVRLKKSKHIIDEHYTKEKVQNAIARAKALHNKDEDWPRELGTTVYKLLENIAELDAQY